MLFYEYLKMLIAINVCIDSPRFTALPSNKTVNIGQIAILLCRAVAQDNPLITWYKVDQNGRFQQVSKANVLVSGDLEIKSTQRSDRSRYACRACNAADCVTTPVVLLNVLCK